MPAIFRPELRQHKRLEHFRNLDKRAAMLQAAILEASGAIHRPRRGDFRRNSMAVITGTSRKPMSSSALI